MINFKAGQEIIFIGQEVDYIYASPTKKGDVYIIDLIDEDGTLQLVGKKWWYDSADFIPLTAAAALLYKNLPTGHKLVDTSEHF